MSKATFTRKSLSGAYSFRELESITIMAESQQQEGKCSTRTVAESLYHDPQAGSRGEGGWGQLIGNCTGFEI